MFDVKEVCSIVRCNSPPEVSIIVVSKFFPNSNIEAFLYSTKLLSVKHEIIVAASTLGEMDVENYLRDILDNQSNLVKARLIHLDEAAEFGPTLGRNIGAVLANSSILLFADDDTVILDDIVSLIRHIRFGIISGVQPLLLKSVEHGVIDSAGDFVVKGRPIFHPSIRGYGLPMKTLGKLCAEEVPSLRGAFMLVRRDAFFAVGGFDCNYVFHYEDVDLGWRLTCAGFRLLFVPSVRVEHRGSRTRWEKGEQTEGDLKLGIVNLYVSHLKIQPLWRWPYLFLSFQQEALVHARARKNKGQVRGGLFLADLIKLNKMFFNRFWRVKIGKKFTGKKIGMKGKSKLEDMASGNRFIYKE